MNRRKFIASGAISAAMLSVFPSFAFTSNEATSISKLGKGFRILSSKVNSVSVLNVSNEVKTTHQNLVSQLDQLGYVYDKSSLTKLNESTYLVPLSKRSLLGTETKEIAFIVNGKSGNNFFILNEKLAYEFNSLIENFHENMMEYEKNICASDFVFPSQVLKQKTGVQNTFVYKNKLNNVITLYNNKAVSRAIIG